jgi:hypothetical protein
VNRRYSCLLLIIGLIACAVVPAPQVRAQSDGAKWISLFNGEDLGGWEVTNFGPQGPVRIVDSTIVLHMGDAMTGITWTEDFPRVNYEIVLEAMRIDGHDFFCGLTFPVKDDPCSLIIGGWGGGVVGLSSLDGLDASENETSSFRRFESDRWYAVRLRVTDDSIKAWIDDKPVVDVSTVNREISIRVEVSLSRPLGIASWRTTAALRNLAYRHLRPDEIITR